MLDNVFTRQIDLIWLHTSSSLWPNLGNKELIFHLIPRFGHGDEEVWSQIKSICRVNTLSDLPRPFYFFLKDNGF